MDGDEQRAAVGDFEFALVGSLVGKGNLDVHFLAVVRDHDFHFFDLADFRGLLSEPHAHRAAVGGDPYAGRECDAYQDNLRMALPSEQSKPAPELNTFGLLRSAMILVAARPEVCRMLTRNQRACGVVVEFYFVAHLYWLLLVEQSEQRWAA